jgi:organic hydroperoxide reductase OsmC/OhrA
MILRTGCDMADASIRSGKDTRDSQADGAPAEKPREKVSTLHAGQAFIASAAWSGDGSGAGHVQLPDAGVTIPIAGAREPDGPGAANPEELLLAALAACFVNTWAIFLKKLQLAYAEPAVRVSGRLEDDPAGGLRVTDAVILARVPALLLESDRSRIAKSLELSEKYCIVSKVVRAAMPVRVEIEPV